MAAQSDLWGGIQLVTAPASPGLAVSVEAARRQCRIDLSDDNTLLAELIKDAAAFVEQEIYGNRTLLRTTFDLPVKDFACWPCELRLPRPPLSSVTSVTYYDAGGSLATLDSGTYLVRTAQRAPGTIELAPGQTWPAVSSLYRYPVTIRFVAGYVAGDATEAAIEAALPRQVRRAMLLLIGHWYKVREGVLVGTISKEVEFAVTSLLSQCGWGSYA